MHMNVSIHERPFPYAINIICIDHLTERIFYSNNIWNLLWFKLIQMENSMPLALTHGFSSSTRSRIYIINVLQPPPRRGWSSSLVGTKNAITHSLFSVSAKKYLNLSITPERVEMNHCCLRVISGGIEIWCTKRNPSDESEINIFCPWNFTFLDKARGCPQTASFYLNFSILTLVEKCTGLTRTKDWNFLPGYFIDEPKK